MFRVKILSAGRLAALALFVSVAGALAVYLIIRGQRTPDGPAPPKLQGRVVAVFSNTRYAHEVEGRVRFVLTARVDRTYEDGTHDLEQVTLEAHGAANARRDVVTADRARVSDPSDLARLDAEFSSNVVVQTSDGLTVKTDYVHYAHHEQLAETKELVTFEGDSFSGRATGLRLEVASERVHLLSNVEALIKPRGVASADSDKAARKARKRARRLKRGEPPRDASRADSTSRSDKGTDEATQIRAGAALLDKKQRLISFTGRVVVTQRGSEMRADRMTAFITQNEIERIEARGNSTLQQAGRREISAADIDFYLEEGNRLVHAVATGNVTATSIGPGDRATAQAQRVEVFFREDEEGGAADSLIATGGVRMLLEPAANGETASTVVRELTAEQGTMRFFPDGRTIQEAEVTGGALVTVTPVRAGPKADRKSVRAASMRAAFYEEGNRLRSFNATGGVKVEIEATVPDDHPPRVSTSRVLTAELDRETQDLKLISQEGDFKYNEADRNATAERASYDGSSEVLRLRGGRPTAWDSKAWLQADEIDYDRGRDETHARGDVRTTYYSRETTNDSAPFKGSKSPVFLTADRANARNKEGIAVYTGSARAWQDDNFIKADRIELFETEKRMVATGSVESALYSAKRREAGNASEAAPGFASADRMSYSDKERLLRYEGRVRARQGDESIQADSVEVLLKQEANEVERLMAEGNVVLTQPGRWGTGDRLSYTDEDGRAVLTGRLARIEDREQGAIMGAQLTFYSRDDKVFVHNQDGTSRVRTAHRLTRGKKD